MDLSLEKSELARVPCRSWYLSLLITRATRHVYSNLSELKTIHKHLEHRCMNRLFKMFRRIDWLELVLNKKKQTKFSFDARIDYGLILPAFMLILIGLYALYVALSHDHPTQATQMLVQQGTWIVVGLFIALIVMHMDSRFLWNLTPFFTS